MDFGAYNYRLVIFECCHSEVNKRTKAAKVPTALVSLPIFICKRLQNYTRIKSYARIDK